MDAKKLKEAPLYIENIELTPNNQLLDEVNVKPISAKNRKKLILVIGLLFACVLVVASVLVYYAASASAPQEVEVTPSLPTSTTKPMTSNIAHDVTTFAKATTPHTPTTTRTTERNPKFTSSVTSHTSSVKSHTSSVTSHTSSVASHTSSMTSHTSVDNPITRLPTDADTTKTPASDVTTKTIASDVTTKTPASDVTTKTIASDVTTKTIASDVTTKTIASDVTTKVLDNDVTTKSANIDITSLPTSNDTKHVSTSTQSRHNYVTTMPSFHDVTTKPSSRDVTTKAPSHDVTTNPSTDDVTTKQTPVDITTSILHHVTTKPLIDDVTTKSSFDDVTTKSSSIDVTTNALLVDVSTKTSPAGATTKSSLDDVTTKKISVDITTTPKSNNVTTTPRSDDVTTKARTYDVTTKPRPDDVTTISTTTTTRGVVTTTPPKPQEDAILFVEGRYNFNEAKKACADIGLQMALKGDMEKAFQQGYERCTYGWLGDMHAGYVMQKEGARAACGGGIVGLIYTPLKQPNNIVSGVYCSPIPADLTSDQKDSTKTNKTVNWWATLDPADAYHLKTVLESDQSEGGALMTSMRVVFPCCNFINVTRNKNNKTEIVLRTTTDQMSFLSASYKNLFHDVAILPHIAVSYDAMMTYDDVTVDALLNAVVTSQVNGVVVDYEPVKNYNREHAEIYREFLDKLSAKFTPLGLEVGMMTSSWGILKYYDVYATSNCTLIGSMSNTYYGGNVTTNEENVEKMLDSINPERLYVGIGAMHRGSMGGKNTYDWTESKLESFLDWLSSQSIVHLHIYPGDWKKLGDVAPFFLSALRYFLSL